MATDAAGDRRPRISTGRRRGEAGRRPPSMSEVARTAGVSLSTVSHVVNQTRPVAPATELAVRNAMAELGYVPGGHARSLRALGTRTLGLAMSAITNPYFGDAVHAVEQAASTAGFSLLLADTHDEVAFELRAISALLERQVDAIILAPSPDPSRAVRQVTQHGVPLILIDRFWRSGIDQVGSENLESTAGLVDHLVSIGHRRIGMISGRPGLATTTERVEGFERGLVRNDLPPRPELLASGNSDAGAAGEALRTLLSRPDPPSAVVVGNNQMTVGTLRATRALGIRIPDDLALVAFDDFEWAEFFEPGLTVAAQDTAAMGAQAVRMALERVAHPQAPARRVVLATTFMHRTSCGCPRER